MGQHRSDHAPSAVSNGPWTVSWRAVSARIVPAELDGDLVGERKDVAENRPSAASQPGKLANERLGRECLVKDLDGRQRTHFERRGVHDAERPIAAADLLHERGI